MISSIRYRRLLRPKGRLLPALLVVVGLAYPLLVYYGLKVVSYQTVGIGLLALLIFRAAVGRRGGLDRREQLVLGGSIIAVAVLFLIEPQIAVKAYPLIVNLILALVFGYSLLVPPTAIERIALIAEPNLDDDGRRYTRKVTWVWLVFFLANGSVAGMLALYGSLEMWTLYNGLIAYLLIGSLFGGELLVRHFVRKRRL